jgi:hypothetical protein|nr:MAG TPA: hypothetical protein [Herelleviridae sp.]
MNYEFDDEDDDRAARPSDALATFRQIEKRNTDKLWQLLLATIERAKESGCRKIEFDWTIVRHPEDIMLTSSEPKDGVMGVKIYNSRAYNHETIFQRFLEEVTFSNLMMGEHPDLYNVIAHITLD